MTGKDSRPRVSVVILRNEGREVLMVPHGRKDGSTYWQLPGGGLHAGERAEDGALRELWEETGLRGRVVRWLFSIPYKYGSSSTFLVEIEDGAEAMLGVDPEEIERDFHKLIGLAWQRVDEVDGSPEVQALQIVLGYLDKLGAET